MSLQHRLRAKRPLNLAKQQCRTRILRTFGRPWVRRIPRQPVLSSRASALRLRRKLQVPPCILLTMYGSEQLICLALAKVAIGVPASWYCISRKDQPHQAQAATESRGFKQRRRQALEPGVQHCHGAACISRHRALGPHIFRQGPLVSIAFPPK